MGIGKIGSSLELGSKRQNTKQKLSPRDILIGLIVGYVVGILVMMLIHLVIQKTCINCAVGDGSTSSGANLREDCFEGWIILAGEKTCFFESYFEVNWSVVEPEAGTNRVDEYFNRIGNIQDINDDILVGTVFNDDRGLYHWMGGASTGNTNQLPADQNTTAICVGDLQEAPVGWGLNLKEAESNDTCFM